MTLQRFYFQIRSANVLECIWAYTLTDAKEQAAKEWLPYWAEMEWLDAVPDEPTPTNPITAEHVNG